MKKIFIFLIVLLLIVGAGVAGYFFATRAMDEDTGNIDLIISPDLAPHPIPALPEAPEMPTDKPEEDDMGSKDNNNNSPDREFITDPDHGRPTDPALPDYDDDWVNW